MVYITRNPMDTLTSRWYFFYKKCNYDVPIEESFANFCKGVKLGGPYFDHVLEYWRVCNEKPGALFLTYEELKKEPHKNVKRLAEFLECPLNPNEIDVKSWFLGVVITYNLTTITVFHNNQPVQKSIGEIESW